MVKKARLLSAIVLLSFLSILAGCVSPGSSGQDDTGSGSAISLTGSAPMYPLVQSAAYAYMGAHSGVKITVFSGDNTTRGIEELLAGEITVCDSTRPPTEDEYRAASARQIDLHMTQVGSDAVCVLVNPANPVNDLSMAQLNDIFFTGKISDWGQLTNWTYNGTIHVYAVNSSISGVSSQFNLVVAGSPATPYTAGYRHKLTDADIAAGVAGDKLSISFTSLQYAKANVKVANVNGVYPSQATVRDATYPISMHFYMITSGQPTGLSKDFINYLLSAEGQKLVSDSGFISIR